MFLDKTPHEHQLIDNLAKHFQSHARTLGAIEVEGDDALELLNYGHCLTAQIDQNFSKNQKELTDDDQLMCQVVICNTHEQ